MRLINIAIPLCFFLACSFAFSTEFRCEIESFDVSWTEQEPGLQWTKYDLKFTPYDRDTHTWNQHTSRSVTVRAIKSDLTLNKLLFHESQTTFDCKPRKDLYIRKLVDHAGISSRVIGAVNSHFFTGSSILGLAIDENRIWLGDVNHFSGIFTIFTPYHPVIYDRNSFVMEFGIAYCNITKCCTEVCPENIKITDNAIIPMKERVVTRFYDPIARLFQMLTGTSAR